MKAKTGRDLHDPGRAEQAQRGRRPGGSSSSQRQRHRLAADDLHPQRKRAQPRLHRRGHRLLRAVQRQPDDEDRGLHQHQRLAADRPSGRRDHRRPDPAARRDVTTGLKAPDGIVGTLPSYPGAPAGSTVVLYTEKLLAYFIVGTTDGSVERQQRFKAGTITLPDVDDHLHALGAPERAAAEHGLVQDLPRHRRKASRSSR